MLVTLFRGVIYRDDAPQIWQGLLDLQARVRDYVSVLGLELILDQAEGYGYLRQRPRTEIVELLRVFLGETANEAKLMDRIDQHINRVIDLGFLRRLRSSEPEPRYEVQRILKAFVDAQWLNELDERLRDDRFGERVRLEQERIAYGRVQAAVDAGGDAAQH